MNSVNYKYLLLIWLISNTLLSATIVKYVASVGIMDNPNQRSSHTFPIPKGGGIGIISAFLTANISFIYLFNQHYSLSIIGLLSTITFISLFSWLDDIKQWSALSKLAIQFIASVSVCIFVFPASFLENHLYLLPFFIIWLVYITNAYNFMDGLNGLAAGVAAICCLFIYFYSTNMENKIFALSLLTGLLGFLPFNFPKAEIFMGDVGSQACGLILASFAIIPLGTAINSDFVTLISQNIIIFFLLFGFIFDVTFTLIRRIINKEPFLQAHRSHLYQMAHRSHISPILITFIECLFCIWGGFLFYIFPLTSLQNIELACSLLILPQLIWTLFILYKTQSLNIKKW